MLVICWLSFETQHWASSSGCTRIRHHPVLKCLAAAPSKGTFRDDGNVLYLHCPIWLSNQPHAATEHLGAMTEELNVLVCLILIVQIYI